MTEQQREEIRSVLMHHSNGVTDYDVVINEIARILSPLPDSGDAEEVLKEMWAANYNQSSGYNDSIFKGFADLFVIKAMHTHAANEVRKALVEFDMTLKNAWATSELSKARDKIAELEKELAEKDKSEPEIKLPTNEEIRSYFADVNFPSMYIPAAQWLRDEVKRLNGIK